MAISPTSARIGAAAWGGELVLDDAQLVLDDDEHALLAGEDVQQVLDVSRTLVVFVLHLVAAPCR
ncbi:MAG: hypothetical protein QM755_16940 [Luteolibacter sp.]